MSFQSTVKNLEGETSKYLIVDCLSEEGELVK